MKPVVGENYTIRLTDDMKRQWDSEGRGLEGGKVTILAVNSLSGITILSLEDRTYYGTFIFFLRKFEWPVLTKGQRLCSKEL